MTLPEFSVKRPIFTYMIFGAVLLVGLLSFSQMSIDLLPDIEIPAITVVTMYPGASTEDVETRVTKLIEDNVSTVSDLKEVTSKSYEGVSAVTLQFEWNTNLDEAANDIRQNLDFAKRDLPDDAEDPMIVKFDLSMMPVMVLGVTADQSYENLYKIADEDISDRLKRIPGVATAEVIGGREREIQVRIDRQRMESFGLSISSISTIIGAENMMLPAGNLKIGAKDFSLRIPGEYKTVEEIGSTIIGMSGQNPVRLSDVATVEDSHQEVEQVLHVSGRNGLILMVMKQSGANTVDIAANIKKALPAIESDLPSDVQVATIMDSSDFIKNSISNLGGTIFWAILFVMLVVIFFLHEMRGSIIIALTIPFSLIVAFILMYALDYTINMMSLSAIAIAIGMVVDNAIVVYENIYRHRAEEFESKEEASIWGASEVGTAIMASTLTTVAIFVPIIFVQGITGVMFKQLGIVVIVVLSASLFCALTLTPMLSSRLLRLPDEIRNKPRFFSALEGMAESIIQVILYVYESILKWSLRNRFKTVIIGLLIFVSSLGVAIRYLPTEFMPENDQGELNGTIKLPIGTRVEVTTDVMQKVEAFMKDNIPEMRAIFARCGTSTTGMESIIGSESDTHIISIGGRLVPKNERKRSDKEIGRLIAEYAKTIPGVVTVDFSGQNGLQQIMNGGGKAISVELYGNDINETNTIAVDIKTLLESVDGITDVTISREMGKPELWIELDRDKATTLGINMATVASTLRSSFYGVTASKYRDEGDEYDLFVRYGEQDRLSINDVMNTIIMTPSGKQIPLKSIGSIKEEKGPVTLERKDQGRVVYIEGGLYGRSLGEVLKDLQPKLAAFKVPSGMDLVLSGTAEDQAESFRWLFFAFFAGIILIYMVMAAQFESLLDPFIIMFSVPFAVVGVIWGLLLTGYSLSIISFVGMIMLVGIVVNNGIVLVDYTNILRARGVPVNEAIIVSCRRRFRPVLMTALTTLLALFPMAISSGEGSETWSPLGVSVMGGLLVSTVITLVFVPTIYSIFENRLKNNNHTAVSGGVK